jgi:hypothetical protein
MFDFSVCVAVVLLIGFPSSEPLLLTLSMFPAFRYQTVSEVQHNFRARLRHGEGFINF